MKMALERNPMDGNAETRRRTVRLFIAIWVAAFLAGCTAPELIPIHTPSQQVFTAPQASMNSGLRISQQKEHDFFGATVDFEGERLVSGAPEWNYGAGECLGSAYVFAWNGSEWILEGTLLASDRQDGFQYDPYFGESVGLSGSIVAVGAPGADDPEAGDNTGAVYIFEFVDGAWKETARLAASQPVVDSRLGETLALSGDSLAAAGSRPADAPGPGNVIIFERQAGSWAEQASLPLPHPPPGEMQEVLLDLHGDTLAVSVYSFKPIQEDSMDPHKRTGMVILYERRGSAWEEVFQTPPLEAYTPGLSLRKAPGFPVALGGDLSTPRLLAVGATAHPQTSREQGSVMIYSRGQQGWVQQDELKLLRGKPVPGHMPFFVEDPASSFFGTMLAFEGDLLAVTSLFSNALQVFERQGEDWIYQVEITPGVNAPDDWERRSLALDSSRLVLGAPGEIGGGAVFVFTLTQ